jgi:hypothetical protein
VEKLYNGEVFLANFRSEMTYVRTQLFADKPIRCWKKFRPPQQCFAEALIQTRGQITCRWSQPIF